MFAPKKSFTQQQIDSFRRAAKAVAKARGIAHSAALDEIAAKFGHKNWSTFARGVNRGATSSQPPSSSIPIAQPSVEEIVEWFRAHHTLAVEESPWDGAEGAYQYPVIEDVAQIQDILRDQYPGVAEADIVEAAAELDDGEPWLDPEFVRGLREDAMRELREPDDVALQPNSGVSPRPVVEPSDDDLADLL